MRINKNWLAVIGILLFIAILATLDSEKILSVLLQINLQIYAVALAALLVILFLKSLKWKIVLSSLGINISLRESVHLYLIGLFIGNITPGKIGDFAKAAYLKKPVSIASSVASVFIDRAIDIAILCAFTLVGSVWFAQVNGFAAVPFEVPIALVLAAIACAFILKNEKYLRTILRPLFKILVPEKYKQSLSSGYLEFFVSIKSSLDKPHLFAFCCILGIIIWLVSASIFYLLSLSLSINLPIEVMFMVFPLMSLSDLLPVSFSGIGTREAVLILLLSSFSVSAEVAVALSVLVFFTGHLIISALGFVAFLSKPMEI